MTLESDKEPEEIIEEMSDKSKEWLNNIAGREYVRVYVNIATGSFEMNCPAARVEDAGRTIKDYAMEFIKNYDKHCTPEDEDVVPPDNRDVA